MAEAAVATRRPSVPVLTFLGAAGTVTGSRFLLDTPRGRVLVDAGLFQGPKALRLRNWEPFPVPASSIDAIVLTHAHVDHSGLIPRLAAQGFDGPVYCTPGTLELSRIVLPDSGHLHEEEAAYANRMGFSKHDPALPLYTEQDARNCLAQFRPIEFGSVVSPVDDVTVVLRRAGHILGAAWVDLMWSTSGRRIAFSGDLGRSTHPLLRPPEPLAGADVVVCESTYGDEEHPELSAQDVLADVINRTFGRGGVVLVPAFAVDRTEVVLWHLQELVASGRVPRVPVFVDSPMATAALDAYRRAAAAGAPELRESVRGRPLFGELGLQTVRTREESEALNARPGPMIIVSASGMATGGRVLHHLAHRVGDHRNTVMLVGFQAPGTRGAALVEGAAQVKMFGLYRQVRAEIAHLPLSAHADRSDLLEWVRDAGSADIVYAVHGEPNASAAFAESVRSELGIAAVAPRDGERVRLDH
ncbi:MAG: MBL fold metallo-hydrolase [Acidimicrobiales bacterium]|nr:MBL fold metallo-hydrolase [Acidimicrobiales bacterium]